MPRVSGLGSTVAVTDAGAVLRTISLDITNYTFTTPRGLEDITGVNKFANERLLLLVDFTVTLNGTFDPDANLSHSVFSTVTSTSVTRSVSLAPTAVTTTPILTVNCVLTDYQITRANTGELTWQVPGSLADGAVPTWA